METNDPNNVLYGFEATKRKARQLDINCKFLFDAVEVIYGNLCTGPGGTWQDRVRLAVAASKRIKTKQPDYNDNRLYYHVNGKVYDKKCYNCVVEWLDDQCSHEQGRCDSCIVDGIRTKWEIDQWRLNNDQLTISK